jgi:RHS repeat-associated protein
MKRTSRNGLMQGRYMVMLLFIIVCSGLTARAQQMTVSGQTCATIGDSYTYSVSSSYTSGYPTQWQVSGGTITATNSISQNGTGLSSITVVWNSSSCTVNVHVYSPSGPSGSLSVSGTAAIVPGTISGNSSQTVYNTTPGTISCTAATYGGCAPVSYNYQWQQSTDQASWSDVSGATGQNLSFSGHPSVTTWYRRYVVSNAFQSGYSGVAVVNVLPPLNGGTALPASQTIFSGSAPGTLSVNTINSGGNCSGNYGYQWLSSFNGSSFSIINGATSSSYTPPVLTQTMYYQLRITCAGEPANSSVAVVNVYPHLAAGTISSSGTTINYNTPPGTISATAASGGNCSGSYDYHWQQSTDGNVSFNDISGATSLSYAPGNLTATRGYRLRISCNTETVYTGIYTATVYPQVTPGSISTTATGTINYNTSASFTGTAAGGGNGSYGYQWQSAPGTTGTFTDITGATGANYGPVNLTATTSYRRMVASNGTPPVASNTVTVTVYPQLVAGTANGTQTINYNTAAAGLSSAVATGGNGSYTYQWQSSSSAGGPFANITGATALTYNPGTLTATTYYRLAATSNGVPATGNTVTVTVYPQLSAGVISPASQTINYGAVPLTMTATASGGSGTYGYQWQSSASAGGPFTDITGATGASYTPGSLTSTTYYQRKVNSNGVPASTATATITVYPQLSPGSISASPSTINYNASTSLSGTAASGGNGSYSYQWQSSASAGGPFADITGATGANYGPVNLTVTTTYRRMVTSNGTPLVSSNAVTVTVYPQVVAGTANGTQTINYNTVAAGLSSAVATGGNGSYTYQWQSSSSAGGTFANITGATALTYNPGTLTATTYYRLVATSNGISATGNTVTVTVLPQLGAGTISPATQTINYNTVPLTMTATASGGNGTFNYQWQSSASAGGPFTDITGATGVFYTPAALTATTYYQRKVTSNGFAASTATATITVYPQLSPGSINASPSTINYNTSTTLSGTAASGGNGTYGYQWQSMPGTTGTFTDITGATGANYGPVNLTTTTTYRRMVTSNGTSPVASNTVTVTVYPQLSSGAISPLSQTVLPNTNPVAFTVGTGSGGSGAYTYQWQQSSDNVSFTNISGATGQSYLPPAAAATIYYRVVTQSNGPTVNSASAAVIITACLVLNTAPSQDRNYVMTSIPLKEGVNPDNTGNTACQVMQTISYVDGLGRPVQTVQVKGSFNSRDMVQPMSYDQFGRQDKKYLPYAVSDAASSNGSYKTGALSAGDGVWNFYYPNGSIAASGTQQPGNGIVYNPQPVSVMRFENSPLSRVTEQGSPGVDWQPDPAGPYGHTKKVDYYTNNTVTFASVTDTANAYSAALYKVSINADQSRTLSRAAGTAGYYQAGSLYITVTRDENWKAGRGGTTEEYKDKSGRIVLKRTFNYITVPSATLQVISTYYVYDDLGNLAYVLTPMSQPDGSQPASLLIDNVCYQYRYDGRGRLTQKKVPGKGWERLYYNKLDQPVLVQDARQAAASQFTVTKYDGLNRVIMTGLWNATAAQVSTLQADMDSHAQWDTRDYTNTVTGYTSGSYPALDKTLSVNYYDDYGFTNITGLPPAFNISGNSVMTKGLLTGTKTAVLNTLTSGSPDMLWTAHYFDDMGRNRRSFAQHYLGGVLSPNNYDEIASEYSFINQLTKTMRIHWKNVSNAAASQFTIYNEYAYDNWGRKLRTLERISNGQSIPDQKSLIILSQSTYNEAGQLMTKGLHGDGGSFKQNISYSYNEPGWLQSLSSALFAEKLQYNTNTVENAMTPASRYNGDISAQSWGVPGSMTKTYVYKYDQLNRLKDGLSSDINNEQNITYDLSGNILKLQRTSGSTTLTDDLIYTYTSGGNVTSQLQSVNDQTLSDAGQTHGTFPYGYDANGNMVSDAGKGITGANGITYNLLNLPETVPVRNTTYVYNASGQKLRRIIGTATTDYVDGIQYEGTTSGSPVMSFIQTEEGRAIPDGAQNYNYEYALTDHLGNTRVSFDTGTGTARQVQVDDYYPFGLDILRGSRPNPGNDYLYNKKELQTNLKLYDYGARFYDPVIARWTSVDPMAEIQRKWNPYNYALNNPVRLVDPDGMNPLEGGTSTFERRDGTIETYDINTFKTISVTPPDESAKEPEPSEGQQDGGIQPVTDKNKKSISNVSWGETSGLYPTKTMEPTEKEKYTPALWDPEKVKQLLAARAAIDFIYNNRNSFAHTSKMNFKDYFNRLLAPYHLKDNFPEVDAAIKNDASVKFFYLSSDKDAKTPAISAKFWDQKIVKTYGPFYNIGGGDAKGHSMYIIFYKMVPKK